MPYVKRLRKGGGEEDVRRESAVRDPTCGAA
jgi:hypothetical protein